MDKILPPPIFQPEEIGPRCLVTGGAGYVGSAIIRRLRGIGCTVRSFDRVVKAHGDDVESMQGDITRRENLQRACEGMDTVFHTAALIKLITLARPAVRRQVFEVNVEGTRKLLAAAREAGVQAFVHTSTGNVVMDRVLKEKDEAQPYATRSHDLYTLTKIAAEKLVLAADGARGVRACAVRPGGLWGPDINCVMIRSFLDQLAAGRFTAVIGNMLSTMDNTHIENLVDGQLLAARGLRQHPERVGGQAYFIFDNERLNPVRWFQPLAEALGYAFPTRRLPGGLAKAVAWGMEAAHVLGAPEPVLTVRSVRNLLESSSLRIDKARRDLGYIPRYSRDTGLPEVVPAARRYIDSRKAGLGVGA